MANTSATGGYLTPTNVVLEDDTLRMFLHGVIAGVTGLDNTLVRPAYQEYAPTRPNLSVNWCGFAIVNRRTNAMPWKTQDDEGNATLSTNELFDCLVSFYGPNSGGYASTLRSGLEITQNLEELNSAGMTVTGTSDILYVPEIINDRWFERYDVTVNLNRNLSRTYDILSLLGVEGTFYFDDVAVEEFTVGDTI